MKLKNIDLAIGAHFFPLYDLLWGIEQVEASKEKENHEEAGAFHVRGIEAHRRFI